MKQLRNRKLTLNRETLAPLTNDALDQVHGGVFGPSCACAGPAHSEVCATKPSAGPFCVPPEPPITGKDRKGPGRL